MATRVWLGGAVALPQITTITVADTWATGDTATLTINGKDITVTVGTDDAVADVAEALAAAVNGAALVNDETRNTTGDLIGEFAGITASFSGAVLTLTGDTAGVPFTVSVSESTAGDGTLGSPSAVQAATGPWHFDNADNWSGGAVPADSDAIVFDDRAISDLFYALDQGGVTPASITITQGFTKRIGLPEINEDSTSFPYDEYRDTYLKLCDSGDTANTAVTIGQGPGQGSPRIKLDFNTGQITALILNTGTRENEFAPALLLKGSHASNAVTIRKGDVGIAHYTEETATVATLRVGNDGDADGDAQVRCGAGVTLTTIEQDGGVLEINSAATTINKTRGTLTINGAGAVTTLNNRGGDAIINTTGTITTILVAGDGHLDFSRDLRAKTITNAIEVYGADARISDPHKVANSSSLVLDFNETDPGSDRFDLGTNIRLTRAATA